MLVDSLKANLIGVSQLCDKGMDVVFRPNKCIIIDCEENLLFEALRNRNVYTIVIIDLTNQSVKCLAALEDVLGYDIKDLDMLILILYQDCLTKGLYEDFPY